MTDNEIIKEFETLIRCANFVGSDYVTSPFEVKYLLCAIDLINRQKAEIEKLQKAIIDGDYNSITAMKAKECWHRENSEYIERLKAEIDRLYIALEETQKTAKYWKDKSNTVKDEAYKEFAERLCDEWLAVVLLKNKSDDYAEGYHDALCFVEERIDNLLKEIGGEDR